VVLEELRLSGTATRSGKRLSEQSLEGQDGADSWQIAKVPKDLPPLATQLGLKLGRGWLLATHVVHCRRQHDGQPGARGPYDHLDETDAFERLAFASMVMRRHKTRFLRRSRTSTGPPRLDFGPRGAGRCASRRCTEPADTLSGTLPPTRLFPAYDRRTFTRIGAFVLVLRHSSSREMDRGGLASQGGPVRQGGRLGGARDHGVDLRHRGGHSGLVAFLAPGCDRGSAVP